MQDSAPGRLEAALVSNQMHEARRETAGIFIITHLLSGTAKSRDHDLPSYDHERLYDVLVTN